MKNIVVLSDLHLGDPASGLLANPDQQPLAANPSGAGTAKPECTNPSAPPMLNSSSRKERSSGGMFSSSGAEPSHPPATLPVGGVNLGWFQKAQKELGLESVDYLVLAGDALDFSIAPFKEAYSSARQFFTALRRLDIVEEIIYIPGNHDKDIWDSVQKEVRVFRRLRERRDPADFPYEQPGIIDLSSDEDGVLNLPGVNYARGRKRKKQYGDLFLEGLFPKGEHIPVSVVYPSLYVILPSRSPSDAEKRWILVTHGHLFELAWLFITEVFGEMFKQGADDPPKGGLKWLEECNIPANSLICTGLGQGGPSTRFLRLMLEELKGGKPYRATKVVKAFTKWLDERVDYGFPLEIAQDAFLLLGEKLIIHELNKLEPSRGNETFLSDRKKFISDFLDATRLSMSAMKDEGIVPRNLAAYPDSVIFGHTHLPIFANEPQVLDLNNSDEARRKVKFLNTGSCLRGETAAMVSINEDGSCSSARVDFSGH